MSYEEQPSEVGTECFDSYRIHYRVFEYRIDFELVRTDGLSDDEPDMSGFLKWDGCLNYCIGCDGHYAHMCSVEQSDELVQWVRNVYALGPRMDKWDR